MHIHLDPVGGIAGDMFVAALLDVFPDQADNVIRTVRLAGLDEDIVTSVLHAADGVLVGKRFDVRKLDGTGQQRAGVGHEHAPQRHAAAPGMRDHPHGHLHHAHADEQPGVEADAHSAPRRNYHHEHTPWGQLRARLSRSGLPEGVKRHEPDRLGLDEAILCARKSDAQLLRIMDELLARGASALMTRLEPDAAERLSNELKARLDYDPISRTGYFNWTAPGHSDFQPVAIVAAGSSDMPQAAEAIRTLAYFGVRTERFMDVGVAGLWRLLDHIDRLKTFPVVIAVAGMDGALPSVLGGLIPGSIICVPTSTGYGASRNGETALCAALSSCAPGLTVVNIDNGYGAACAAYRIVNALRQCRAQGR